MQLHPRCHIVAAIHEILVIINYKDKAYINLKKIPYDVIKKKKKNLKSLFLKYTRKLI